VQRRSFLGVELIVDHDQRSPGKPRCGVSWGSRKSAGKDPAFEILVRGKVGGKFATPAAVLEAEEVEELSARGIPSLKRASASGRGLVRFTRPYDAEPTTTLPGTAPSLDERPR
jgi:hypothetical protein